MSLWWYVEGREVNGPCSLSKLNGLLKDQKLTAQTWVWSQELVRWTRAKDVPVLTAAHGLSASDDYTDLSPIDLPVPDPDGPQRPGPWTRWIVQYADLQLISVPVYLLIWLAGQFVTLPDLTFTWPQWVINLTLVALGLWVQGLMIGRFGTTPFKRMVGIRIETVDGSPLTQAAAHRRQLSLWWRGMGLGLPIVEIVTNIIAFIPVSAGRRTDWDEAAGLDVRQSRHRPEILFLVVLTSFLLLYINMLLVKHTSTVGTPDRPLAGVEQQWRNPTTNKIAAVDAGWDMTQESRDDEDPSHWFAARKGYGYVSMERNRVDEPFEQYATQQLAGMPRGALVESRIDPVSDNPRCLRANAETAAERGPVAQILLRVCMTGPGEVWLIKGRAQAGEIDNRDRVNKLATRLELTLHHNLSYLD